MIANNVWDYDFPNVTMSSTSNPLPSQKLDDPYPGNLIQTIRGAGYRLVKP